MILILTSTWVLFFFFYKKSFFSFGSYIAKGFEGFLNSVTQWVCVLNCHFLLLCSFSCSCELRYLLMKNMTLWKYGLQAAPAMPRVLLGGHFFLPSAWQIWDPGVDWSWNGLLKWDPKDKEMWKWLRASRGNLIILTWGSPLCRNCSYSSKELPLWEVIRAWVGEGGGLPKSFDDYLEIFFRRNAWVPQEKYTSLHCTQCPNFASYWLCALGQGSNFSEPQLPHL